MQTTVLILAAGGGTRMKSSRPKVTFDLLGKPLVRWVVDAAKSAGCDNIITVLGHGREVVEPIVQDTQIVYQEQRLGTGHAVMCAASVLQELDGTIVVLSGDCPLITSRTIIQLAQSRETLGASAVVLTAEMKDPFGYGRIVRDENDNFIQIVEQRDCTPEQALINEVNSGMYAFDSKQLLKMLDGLSNNNAQNEYYLTDVIELLVADGKKVSAIQVDDISETMGINTRVQLAQATKVMQRRINEQHMLNGVSMPDPDLVWIGADVKIDQDVELLPMTMLSGNTIIAAGCVIGPSSRITNSVLGHDCRVEESIIIDSQLDDNVSCGPRAYIRPGVHMCEGSKAGTHVELKNSVIGAGSKVPHLSYIGDTEMGEGVNIGAGSITCNYDGVSKNKTIIGDNSFIGSDTMMVAPVILGKEVVTAAGSTVTKDVPNGGLAVGRAKQYNIENYFEHKMKKSKDNE